MTEPGNSRAGMWMSAGLRAAGLCAFTAWRFDLYGGAALLAATRDGDEPARADEAVESLLAEDARIGVLDPGRFARLQQEVEERARAV